MDRRRLKRPSPPLRVCIVERDSVGFGASGRNGGWCSALFPIGLGALAGRHGREAAIRLQRALIDTVDEVAAFADGDAAVGVDVQFRRAARCAWPAARRSGRCCATRSPRRREFGFGADDLRLLDPDELATRSRAHDAVAASYSPHCAALHPLRLAQALAATARSLGVRIVEGVEVLEPVRALVTGRDRAHAGSPCWRPRPTPPACPAAARRAADVLDDGRLGAAVRRRSGTRSASPGGRRSRAPPT